MFSNTFLLLGGRKKLADKDVKKKSSGEEETTAKAGKKKPKKGLHIICGFSAKLSFIIYLHLKYKIIILRWY